MPLGTVPPELIICMKMNKKFSSHLIPKGSSVMWLSKYKAP